MFSDNPKWAFGLFGTCDKFEVLKFLGIGMGGILLALQALASHRRARAMEDTVRNTEQGQLQERLKNAIEHLGSTSRSVRMGGAYELFHLADDIPRLRQTVFDILCAHIRRTTNQDTYRNKYKLKPSEEVQSLLTLLFVQDHTVFRGFHINLQGSWLNGADLREARLWNATMTGVHLQEAKLDRAHLQGANLVEAHIQEAFLSEAWLQEADVTCARMQGAHLEKAQLQGSRIMGTFLQGAYLDNANLQGAYLQDVRLHGAYLVNAQFQGALLSYVYLLGAILSKAKLQGAGEQTWTPSTPFACRIRESIDKKSNLSRLVFGGIEQEAVDYLVEGLSPEKEKMLRMQLASHIGKPLSHQLPENSGAITGSYTEEEAEQWIVEYEEAMLEVPGDDSQCLS